MSEQSYGLQESPTTVRRLCWIHALGVVFALIFYAYQALSQPATFASAMASTTPEVNILGACFFGFLLILSFMTGKIVTRFGIVSITKSKYFVTAVQVVLAGYMIYHLGIFGYLVFA